MKKAHRSGLFIEDKECCKTMNLSVLLLNAREQIEITTKNPKIQIEKFGEVRISSPGL
jgi:hypothetical protein